MFVLKCACAALLVLSGLATVYLIDKPREPIGRGTAILSLLINAFIAWVLFQ